MKPWEQTVKVVQGIVIIGGAISTLFVLTSGAFQKISAVPTIQAEVKETRGRVDSIEGKVNFLVAILAERYGRPYEAAKWEGRRRGEARAR